MTNFHAVAFVFIAVVLFLLLQEQTSARGAVHVFLTCLVFVTVVVVGGGGCGGALITPQR